MGAPFFILAQPRSRTAWLSAALTEGRSTCLYEAWCGTCNTARFCARLDNVKTPVVGNSDCANALLLDRILALWPTSRLLVIDRDTDSVRSSLARLGLSDTHLADIRTGMERAARLPNTLCVPFDAIGQSGRHIWEHCVQDHEFDAHRWQTMNTVNIQADAVADKAQRHRLTTHALLGGGSWDL